MLSENAASAATQYRLLEAWPTNHTNGNPTAEPGRDHGEYKYVPVRRPTLFIEHSGDVALEELTLSIESIEIKDTTHRAADRLLNADFDRPWSVNYVGFDYTSIKIG